MDMTGERRIAASQDEVWRALADPEILRLSIPGCETLERGDGDELVATVTINVGPIKARFSGRVTLSEIDAPNGYRIGGEGQGGVAGFAKGGATVALATDGTETVLRYAAQAQVGGKIAQLGGRLIDATARKLTDQFFTTFERIVSEKAREAA